MTKPMIVHGSALYTLPSQRKVKLPNDRYTGPSASKAEVGGQGMQNDTPEPSWLERLPPYLVPALLLGVPLFMILLGQVSAGFQDRLDTYYVDPVLNDTGYNPVNTLSWVVLMAVSLLGIAQLMARNRVPADSWMIVGSTSWVLAGTIWHVMEDAQIFEPRTAEGAWLKFFYITPMIYLLFGLGGILSLIVGIQMRKWEASGGIHHAISRLWYLAAIPLGLYLLAYSTNWSQVTVYIHPVYVAAYVLAAFFLSRWYILKEGKVVPQKLILFLSVFPLLAALHYSISFWQAPFPFTGYSDVAQRVVGYDHLANANPNAFWIAPLGALALTYLPQFITRAAKMSEDVQAAFANPINKLMIFGQSLDGVATSLGLDFYGYGEKHVLSAKVINTFQDFAERIDWQWGADHPTFLAFLPLKFLLPVLIIWAMDVQATRKGEDLHPTVTGLLKFAIIMVGFGPGTRNFIRMGFGI